MSFSKKTYNLSNESKRQIQKVIDTLKIGGRSEKTIKNYVYAIHRFLKYFENKNILELDENDILEYVKCIYLNNKCSSNTYNLNLSAIKFFYSINFNKQFNNRLLPHAKLAKRLPSTIDKDTFDKIFYGEKSLKHKCWLLLAYCSGLRAEEVASVKLNDINAEEHQLKVLGKGRKERITFLPEITVRYLRMYYKSYYCQPYNRRVNKTGYLFEGYKYECLTSSTIVNYFSKIKQEYNLDENITFHSLRHSFASNFIKAGGDPFVLKSMMGHSSLNTTSIYIHMGRDFNNLKGVNYDEI